jgi:hypothetical protein
MTISISPYHLCKETALDLATTGGGKFQVTRRRDLPGDREFEIVGQPCRHAGARGRYESMVTVPSDKCIARRPLGKAGTKTRCVEYVDTVCVDTVCTDYEAAKPANVASSK